MTTTTWTIRCARPAETACLTELARSAKAHWGYPDGWLAAWASALTLTPEYLAANRVFAAEDDGAIVGVCALEDRGAHWEIGHLWVDPAHQRRGIGEALVRRALDEVRAIRPGRVMVLSDPNAAGFYERLGGRRVGTTPAPMPGAPGRELPLLEVAVAADPPGANGGPP